MHEIDINEEKAIILEPASKTIIIRNLIIKNEDLYNFLEGHSDVDDAIRKALMIGALGIRSMGTGVNMDYIDKKFAQFMGEIRQKFDEQHLAVQNLISETFDEENAKSPMFKFAKHLENYFNDKSGVVRNIINETFDPENNKSPMGAFAKNLDLYFNESGRVRQMLDTHFDLNTRTSSLSQLVDKLSENFDVEKGTIKKILDPALPGTPVNLLREEMLRNFNDMREKLAANSAKQLEREKGTAKGGDFESMVYEELHEIVRPFRDVVESTGTLTGLTGKTGDFIITTGDRNEKIVVEAKDSINYTIPRTLGEIREAIENRKAAFGIFVFKSQEQMPKALQPCKVERNCIITSLDGGGLYYAYHLAKTILESARAGSQGQIPIDKIQSEVEHLMKKTLVIDEAIKKTQKIVEHVDSVQSTLRVLQSEMDDSLRRIQSILRVNN